jgi:transcriptional regulator with XRE-family HTH domain
MPNRNRNPSKAVRNTDAYQKTAQVLGRNIRKRRDSLDWTQADLASKTGLSRQHIQLIETGKANAALASLVLIAIALEIQIHELFTENPGGQ